MPYTVVIADDITGANDIGIMYAKAGLTTLVYSYQEEQEIKFPNCDVLIVDTDSRFDREKRAYEKVKQSLRQIPMEGVTQFIDKQCSVFRGNIGAEFDAMLDELEESFAVVVLGFPNNGRTTLNSDHYVFGTLLAESQFKNDPVHPMTQSNLVDILQSQTKRKVGAIHYQVYQEGISGVKQALDLAKTKMNYCVMDVRNNQDLELLAELLKDEKIICGSSALSEYLAINYAKEHHIKNSSKRNISKGKVFCMAGSLTPQTIGQTAYMKDHGYCVFELDTREIFTEKGKQEEIKRLETLIKAAYKQGEFVMLHSMNRPELVEETKIIAQKQGMDNTQISSLVSTVLADLSTVIIKEEGIKGVIVCGGDTSAALCQKLGIKGMKVLDEIEAGLPTCQSVDAPYYKMVLKSGSFGTPSFIEKAIDTL